LISLEPIYEVGEWASRYAPDLLGLSPAEVALPNDLPPGLLALGVRKSKNADFCGAENSRRFPRGGK
jgi:hypothetical protein